MAIKRTRNRGISDAKNTSDKVPRIEDVVDMLQLPKDGTDVLVRPVGDTTSYKMHWVKIVTEKKGEVSIGKVCLAWDPETESVDSTKECPYCKLKNSRDQIVHLTNTIVRDVQEEGTHQKTPTAEEKESGFKQRGTRTSPVFVLKVGPGLLNRLQKVSDLNRHKTKTGVRSYDLADERRGMDVFVSYDANQSPSDQYSAQKDEKTALSEEELEYFIYDLDLNHLKNKYHGNQIKLFKSKRN